MPRQRNMPRWARSSINDAKTNILPRFPNKEIEIYLYETNQPIRNIVKSQDEVIIIESKLKQVLKFSYSNQITDFSTPRFENPGDSANWLNQVKGFVYTRIDINPNMYSYISFNIDTSETIGASPKYRLIRNNEFNSNNKFQYTEILATLESIKSFAGFDKANYKLVDKIKLQDKISKIIIELENCAQISHNGIKIFTKEKLNDAIETRNLVKSIDANISDCALNFINIAKVEPLLTNYLSWQYLLDKSDNVLENQITLMWGRGVFSSQFSHNLQETLISFKSNYDIGSHAFYPPKLDFFTFNWDTEEIFENGYKKGLKMYWHKDKQFVVNFFNGNAIDPKTGITFLEIEGNFKISSKQNKLENLDIEKEDDMRWFVLGKNLNLTNQLNFYNETTWKGRWAAFNWKNMHQKFYSLNHEQWKSKLEAKNLKYELILSKNGFSPKIIINQKESNWVKFTIFNVSGEQIFNGVFNTNNKFNDGKFRTTYQF